MHLAVFSSGAGAAAHGAGAAAHGVGGKRCMAPGQQRMTLFKIPYILYAFSSICEKLLHEERNEKGND